MSDLEKRAKALRLNMTAAEKRLWFGYLRGCRVKFTCQKVIGNCILDFYSPQVKVGIEVDGGQHYEPENAAKDNARTEYLKKNFGVNEILRFSNHDVLSNLEGVAAVIENAIAKEEEKMALGKGMGALFSANENVSRETSAVKISLIEPNANQPRKDFEEKALRELADSIKKYGVLQPIILKKNGSKYMIIAGERRYRAAKLAGLKEVPAIVKDSQDIEAAEIALIENLQREDLNPVEEAYAYQALISEYGLKQDEVAEKVSKSRSAITNSLRILKAGDRIVKLLAEGKLTAGHVRALLAFEDQEEREKLADRIIEDGLSVREVEKIASRSEERAKKALESASRPDTGEDASSGEDAQRLFFDACADKLTKTLGTRVNIKNGKNGKGKIIIEYYSLDELNEILEKI